MPFVDNDDNDQQYVKSELGYELWKARELKRILRDKMIWQQEEQQRQEVIKRRNMTDAER